MFILVPSGPEVAHRIARGAQTLGLPAVRVRYEDLAALGAGSGIAYIATLIVAGAVGLGYMAAMVVADERLVIRAHHYEAIDRRAWLGWTCFAARSAFVVWLLFLKDVHLAGNPYPGMGGIFTIPVFPVVASAGPFLLGLFGLVTFAGLRKAML